MLKSELQAATPTEKIITLQDKKDSQGDSSIAI